MTHHRSTLTRLISVGAALIALGAWTGSASAADDRASARAATAGYHEVGNAVDAGYGEFRDAAGIACIDNPAGGMGIHYANVALVGDDVVDVTTPEALVYEPQENGRLRLVALEYIVFQSAWDATHNSAPSLFGQEFELVAAGNRYGIPAFYELHAWLWKHNPSGTFDDWNPRVSCAGAQAQGSSLRRARASAHSIRWTQQQLDQLARAYKEKNPRWEPPTASAGSSPAEKTWTPQALDALAAAYAALNPSWTRP